jgi:hypothetical protein
MVFERDNSNQFLRLSWRQGIYCNEDILLPSFLLDSGLLGGRISLFWASWSASGRSEAADFHFNTFCQFILSLAVFGCRCCRAQALHDPQSLTSVHSCMRHLLFIIFNHLLRAAFLSGHNIACRFHISLFVAMSRYGLRHLFTFIPFRHLPRAHFPGFHAIRGCGTSSSAHLALLLEVFRLSPSFFITSPSFFYHLSSLISQHHTQRFLLSSPQISLPFIAHTSASSTIFSSSCFSSSHNNNHTPLTNTHPLITHLSLGPYQYLSHNNTHSTQIYIYSTMMNLELLERFRGSTPTRSAFIDFINDGKPVYSSQHEVYHTVMFRLLHKLSSNQLFRNTLPKPATP